MKIEECHPHRLVNVPGCILEIIGCGKVLVEIEGGGYVWAEAERLTIRDAPNAEHHARPERSERT